MHWVKSLTVIINSKSRFKFCNSMKLLIRKEEAKDNNNIFRVHKLDFGQDEESKLVD